MTEYIKEEVKAGLQSATGLVTFVKADGTLRQMYCTLQPHYLPEQVEGKPFRKENDEVLSVWDIRNKGWRSFRLDSVQSIAYGVVLSGD